MVPLVSALALVDSKSYPGPPLLLRPPIRLLKAAAEVGAGPPLRRVHVMIWRKVYRFC